jgi:hypothetical protein
VSFLGVDIFWVDEALFLVIVFTIAINNKEVYFGWKDLAMLLLSLDGMLVGTISHW